MRYRKDIVKCYPKQHVIELGSLTRVKSWFITPSDSSSTKKCHDIINKRSLSVWICRSTNNRYMKSFKHYLLSYLKFFTSNPSSQVMTTEIIIMSREIWIELVGGGSRSKQRDNHFLDSRFLRIEQSNSSRLTCLSPHIDLYLTKDSNFWAFCKVGNLVWSNSSTGSEEDPKTLLALVLMFLDFLGAITRI